MSTERHSRGGFVHPSRLPRGENGRALCRQCGTEVPKGRRTFCSEECVHEWRIRRDGAYVRYQVFERDRGVCSVCGVDTVALRQQMEDECRDAWSARFRWALDRGFDADRLTWWDADHIVPVVEGGGECGLENYRTLCLPCHKAVTAELASRRAARRRDEEIAARGQLFLFEEVSG